MPRVETGLVGRATRAKALVVSRLKPTRTLPRRESAPRQPGGTGAPVRRGQHATVASLDRLLSCAAVPTPSRPRSGTHRHQHTGMQRGRPSSRTAARHPRRLRPSRRATPRLLRSSRDENRNETTAASSRHQRRVRAQDRGRLDPSETESTRGELAPRIRTNARRKLALSLHLKREGEDGSVSHVAD